MSYPFAAGVVGTVKLLIDFVMMIDFVESTADVAVTFVVSTDFTSLIFMYKIQLIDD